MNWPLRRWVSEKRGRKCGNEGQKEAEKSILVGIGYMAISPLNDWENYGQDGGMSSRTHTMLTLPRRAGTTLFNLAWFFLAGAASAVDTLVAQAFGARDYAACEYWTRIGYLLMTLLSLPAMIIFQYGEWVVGTVLRQDEHLAHLAGQYTKLLLPGLWPLCMFVTMQKSMQARNVLMPSLYIMLLANFLNVGGNYLFIYALDMGFSGSPLATSTSRILTCLLTAIYYYFLMPKAHPQSVQGQICPEGEDVKGEESDDILSGKQRPQQEHRNGVNSNGSNSTSNSTSKKAAAEEESLRQPLLLASSSLDSPSSSSAFSPVPDSLPPSAPTADTAAAAAAGKVLFREALWRFLCLAVPGGFMVGLEAWSFDFTTSFAAQFGTEALDAHQSMMSISAFTYLTGESRKGYRIMGGVENKSK